MAGTSGATRSKGLAGRKNTQQISWNNSAADLVQREEACFLGTVLLYWGHWPKLDQIVINVDDFEHGVKSWHGYVWMLMATGIKQRWSEPMLLEKLVCDRRAHEQRGELKPAAEVGRLINAGTADFEGVRESVLAAASVRRQVDALESKAEQLRSQMMTGIVRGSSMRIAAMAVKVEWPNRVEDEQDDEQF